MKTGEDLVSLLNQHEIIAIPTIVEEAFGIVALEGIACGCVAIGSEGGGLKEAIGPCGLTSPNGDATALTEQLKRLLTDKKLVTQLQKNSKEHLQKHTRESVFKRYSTLIESQL